MSKPSASIAARFAAALKYADGDSAPRVVAKGEGFVADQIVARAQQAGVAVHTSSVLAAMIRDVPLEQPIPPQLYRVIAELLAWVYQLEQHPGESLDLRAEDLGRLDLSVLANPGGLP